MELKEFVAACKSGRAWETGYLNAEIHRDLITLLTRVTLRYDYCVYGAIKNPMWRPIQQTWARTVIRRQERDA